MIDSALAALFGAQEMDERFVAHRHYSSRIALVVGMLVIVAWFMYDLYAQDFFHTDLAIIAGVMAATKLVAMAFFRLTR
jgi:hypothetical protein